MTAPVFLADGALRRPDVVLDGPEGRHAVSVRRLRPGEEVVLTDGRGAWRGGRRRRGQGPARRWR